MSRPNEGRKKLTCYVLPETDMKIRALAMTAYGTQGRAIDAAFGVQAGANVAGARGGSSRERTGGPSKLSRAKAQNDKLSHEEGGKEQQ